MVSVSVGMGEKVKIAIRTTMPGYAVLSIEGRDVDVGIYVDAEQAALLSDAFGQAYRIIRDAQAESCVEECV